MARRRCIGCGKSTSRSRCSECRKRRKAEQEKGEATGRYRRKLLRRGLLALLLVACGTHQPTVHLVTATTSTSTTTTSTTLVPHDPPRAASRNRPARVIVGPAPANLSKNGWPDACQSGMPWPGCVSALSWPVATMFEIIRCESNGNPSAHNPSGANGLLQILGGPYDPIANLRLGYQMFLARGLQPWNPSRRCWS